MMTWSNIFWAFVGGMLVDSGLTDLRDGTRSGWVGVVWGVILLVCAFLIKH